MADRDKGETADILRKTVRQARPNLYLLSFFAPRAKRDAILALMALDAEIRAIPAKTAEPAARDIRMQWWRDAVMDVCGGRKTPQSPVLDGLSNALCTASVSKDDFMHYFNQVPGDFQVSDTAVITLCRSMLTPGEQRRFDKAAAIHQRLADTERFRALRLWFGVTFRRYPA